MKPIKVQKEKLVKGLRANYKSSVTGFDLERYEFGSLFELKNLKPNPIIFALDLGTKTGWAIGTQDNTVFSGVQDFSPNKRFEGGGMRYLRFFKWLDETLDNYGRISEVYFEEVRRHMGTDAAHMYGGFMATLTGWCEKRCIPYQGVPVKTIKKYVTGTGNASKQMVIDALKSKEYPITDDNEADAIALLLYVRENKL